MYFKTKLNDIDKLFIIKMLRFFSIRFELKYFILINNLFQKENGKIISTKIIWWKKKHFSGDVFLYIKFMKSGSFVDEKLERLSDKLESLLNREVLCFEKSRTYILYTIKCKEIVIDICDLKSENNGVSLGDFVVPLNKYYNWNFHKDYHMLIAGNTGSGKSYMLYSILYNLIYLTPSKNIYICDPKFYELKKVSREIFDLLNVAQDQFDIVHYIDVVVGKMNERYISGKKYKFPIFIVIDEYLSLKLMLNNKDFSEFEKKIKDIILKGGQANVHMIISLQRVKGSDIDLAIRDNLTLKLGFGSMSSENFKMLFDDTKSNFDSIDRKVGEGFIKSNEIKLRSFVAPKVEF